MLQKRIYMLTASGFSTLLLTNALLLLGGRQILVGEEKVEIGQHRIVEDWGDLALNEQATLVCSYLTGQGIKRHIYWYSGDNRAGRNTCPFVIAWK